MTDTPAPEQVTLARRIGGTRHETLNGNTMSMGYVDPVRYIRADTHTAALAAKDAQIKALVEALNDTLAMPKGSIPLSADPFYDGTIGRFTVERVALAKIPG